MPDEQKPKPALFELGGLVKNVNEIAATLAAVIAAITFAAGNRIISYVFILVACVSVSWFLGRVIRRRALAIPLILLIAGASLGWVGVNAWEDYRKAQGILFAPAQEGELLVILCEFKRTGGNEYDVVGRVREPLARAIQDAGIRNVRLERAPAVTSSADALRLGQTHSAVFVIWGAYDSAGFAPHFTIVRPSQHPLEQTDLKQVPAELREFNLYIREGLPAQMNYLAAFTLGQLYYWDDQFDRALQAFDVALANAEQSRRVEGVPLPSGLSALYFYRGYIQRQKGNLDQAITDYTQSLAFDQSAVTYFNRGYAYHLKRNLDAAIADYTQAVELDAQYDAARFALALGYSERALDSVDKEDYERALADCAQAIALDPTQTIAYKVRALAYAEKGDFERAIADYSRVIELDPKDARAYYRRGRAYAERGDLDNAIADYTQTIALDPSDAFAYYYRARAYAERGDLDRAIADYTQSIALDPSDAFAYYERARAQYKQGKLDAAIADYTQSIELDPSDAFAYYYRARAQHKQGKLDAAIADYTQSIELDPQDAASRYYRGAIYRARGLPAQARTDFEMYLQLVPNDDPDRAQVEQWVRELK